MAQCPEGPQSRQRAARADGIDDVNVIASGACQQALLLMSIDDEYS